MDTKTKNIVERLHQLLTLVTILAIPLFVYWRMDMVDAKIGRKFGLTGTFDFAVVNADGYMLAAIFALLLLSWRSVRRKWQYIPRFIVLVLLLFYLADLVLLKQFGTRILFSSVQLYIQYTALVWEQTQEFLGGFWPAMASLAVALAYAGLVLVPPAPPWLATRFLCFALLVASLLAAVMPWKLHYVKSWIVESYLSANIFVPEAKAYSERIANEWLAAPVAPEQCTQGLASDKNVIILVVESLSSYQSKLFGGTENWTPDLDELAGDALIFPRMHANGFSTNEGMVGILGGVRLLSPFSHMLFRAVTPFQTAWGLEETLPRRFAAAGYHTAFLTTGPLSFASIGSWLAEIDFAEIEGGNAAYYENWKKVQFGAAPDEALYARSLEWIAARPPDQPWMLTLATVSTHQPFRDPATMQPDMEAVFRYADKYAASFIRALRDSGYFEQGILLLLGDHRSMTPVTAAEENAYGSAAPARVPLMLFGHGETGVHQGNFQQSDLLPSFKYWLGNEHCQEPPVANLFDPASAGRCAFHVQGARQSLVEVYCPDSNGQVTLDGDNTRFLSSYNMSNTERQRILGIIARQRLAGDKRHRAHMARLEQESPEKEATTDVAN